MPVIEGVDSRDAKGFGDAMAMEFKRQLGALCEQFVPAPAPTLTLAPAPTALPGDDANMAIKLKRSFEEIGSGEDAVAILADDVVPLGQEAGLSSVVGAGTDAASLKAQQVAERSKELGDRVKEALQLRTASAGERSFP